MIESLVKKISERERERERFNSVNVSVKFFIFLQSKYVYILYCNIQGILEHL